jgi:hypothetical protein
MDQRDEYAVASFEEIGRAIGCSTEMARVIYKGAMRKLRKYMRRNPKLAEAWFIYLKDAPPRQRCPRIPEEKIPSFD